MIKGVKKLQKEKRFQAALQEYTDLYFQSLRDGDSFASGLFMDEIVQTLLLKAREKGMKVSEPYLREELAEALSGTHPIEDREMISDSQIEDDIEIAVRRRFPEHHKVGEFVKRQPTDSSERDDTNFSGI